MRNLERRERRPEDEAFGDERERDERERIALEERRDGAEQPGHEVDELERTRLEQHAISEWVRGVRASDERHERPRQREAEDRAGHGQGHDEERMATSVHGEERSGRGLEGAASAHGRSTSRRPAVT